MNFVQPIRNKEIISDIKGYLKERNPRNYMLFVLGINTGLRISDMLKLKVKDVKGERPNIREEKTGKKSPTKINPPLRKELNEYMKELSDNDWLFKSRQGNNKPISRKMAYVIMREIADEFHLENLGCHTLRKTFGYHFYKDKNDIVMLQRIFNHSDPKITLRYIGIEQDEIDAAIDDFSL